MLEVTAEEMDREETNGYFEDPLEDQSKKKEEEEDRNDDQDSRSIISWEVLISLLAAIARILIDILT